MIPTLILTACIFGRLLLALVPYAAEPVEERVSLVETNHFYDLDGRHVFTQVIFQDWNAEQSRYEVVAWRLVKGPGQLPQRDWQRGGYVTVWQDSGAPPNSQLLREVRAEAIRESWSWWDVELEARETLPPERRRGLQVGVSP